jgi:hypothetical protein
MTTSLLVQRVECGADTGATGGNSEQALAT